jgi:hypothetical protein
VHFRLTYQVTGYQVHPKVPLTIRLGGPHNLSVVLQRDADDTEATGQENGLILGCAELEPPPKAASAFTDANVPGGDMPC